MINDNRQLVKEKIDSLVEAQGLELIECKIFSNRSRHAVRCLVDYPAGGVTVDDCGRLNRKIFGMLEETGILGDDFSVEVNSPGIGRPLTTYKDFVRSKEKCVCVWLREPYEKKTYWEGVVIQVSESHVGFMVGGSLLNIELSHITLGKEKIDL